MKKRFNSRDMELVRHILGNEVYRSRKTGKEYLVAYTKTGKSRLVLLRKVM